MAWKLYTDSACTTLFSGTLELVHLTDLSDNPQDNTLWYGEVEEDTGDNGTIKQQAYSNPGTDDIVVSVVDAAVGSGHEADEITLSVDAAGLDTNTAGASLSLGVQLLSGVSNAQPIHVRVENAVTGVGDSTELTLSWVATVDSAA
jgi:hypothetical protein